MRIYKITVTNWAKENSIHKKSFKFSLIPNNFCSDGRLLALPMSIRWFYLNLVLMCGDFGNDTVTITEQQANNMLTSRVGCRNALVQLQSFQLVTFEEIEGWVNKRKEGRKEEKEGKNTDSQPPQAETPPLPPPDPILPPQPELVLEPTPAEPPKPELHWTAVVWNENCGPDLKKVLATTKGTRRMKWIEKRVKEFPNREDWVTAIKNLAKSDFHCGRQKGKTWKADFSWFVEKADAIQKGLEDSFGSQNKEFSADRTGETYDSDPLGILEGRDDVGQR